MPEIDPTFQYRVTQNKNVSFLDIDIQSAHLPYALVLKSGPPNTIQTVPIKLLIRDVDCYLQRQTSGGALPVEAHKVFINIPDNDTSWTLPLFYYADKGISHLVPQITSSEIIMSSNRKVELQPKSNLQKVQDLLVMYSAIHYLQSQRI